MKTKHFILMGLVSAGLFSCSEDNGDKNLNGEKETAYFSLQLAFPKEETSKATTTDEDGDGYQTGLAKEQKFQNVAVVFVKSTTNEVVEYLTYTADDFAPDGNAAADDNNIDPSASPTSKNYETKKAKLVPKGDARVYVFLNPTADVASKFAKGAIVTPDANNNLSLQITDLTSSDISNGIAKDNNFLMGNADAVVAKSIEGTVNYPTLVKVTVERAAVKLVENTATANFTLSNITTKTVTAAITNYGYNNLNKRSFILKKQENRTDAGSFAGSYIVDPNFIEANYNAPFPVLPWYGNDFFTLGNQDLTGAFSTSPEIKYCLENTMISNEQYENKTTSVVYKADLAVSGTPAKTTVYTYKGLIYTSYADLKAIYNADYPAVPDALNVLFKEADLSTAYAKAGADYTASVKAINVKLEDKGIRCYYQGACYYNWPIKHWAQDAPTSGLLGRMEFGVVRNNVYYLKVTSILNIGEPWLPGGPEDPNPDPDPDETEKASIKVSIDVLPWTVRYNDIEF